MTSWRLTPVQPSARKVRLYSSKRKGTRADQASRWTPNTGINTGPNQTTKRWGKA